MKAILAFLLVFACGLCNAAVAKSADACNWDHPGTNKYQRLPVEALQDYDMDYRVRATLQVKMINHWYDDVVEIRRDGVTGNGSYSNLRGMHYGKSGYCQGMVDTGAWAPTQVERALVYCVDTVCVAVPTVCNNVSLIDRDEQIDIQPKAGGPYGASEPSVDQGPGEVGPEHGAPEALPDDGPMAGSFSEVPGTGGQGQQSVGSWPGGWEGDGGGDTVGSHGHHVPPPEPPCPPVVTPPSPVPETPEWIMMAAGLACFVWLWNRRDKRRD